MFCSRERKVVESSILLHKCNQSFCFEAKDSDLKIKKLWIELYSLQTSSFQPLLQLLAVVVYDLPTWTISLYLAVNSARTAVGRSTTPTRQSGTRCQMNLEIQTVSMVLNGSWEQFSLAATSVSSTLEVVYNEMRYIHVNLCFTLICFALLENMTESPLQYSSSTELHTVQLS